jgi:hypothetical protein
MQVRLTIACIADSANPFHSVSASFELPGMREVPRAGQQHAAGIALSNEIRRQRAGEN